MRIKQHIVEQSLRLDASVESVWREITEVDIASFRHPVHMSILGIPKPIRAEMLHTGVGGMRIAHFSNGRRFRQIITEWQPSERFAFTFEADPGFRVAYLLDLSEGPFRMIAGAYRITRTETETFLSLSSTYELRGATGFCLRRPVSLVLRVFQNYLLRGIRTNARRRDRRRTGRATDA